MIYQTRIRDDVVSCVDSVHDIRRKLTSELEHLEPKTALSKILGRMRAACRKFHDSTGTRDLSKGDIGAVSLEELSSFNLALGELRGAIGQEIALLSFGYKIDVEDSLDAILPAEVENDG